MTSISHPPISTLELGRLYRAIRAEQRSMLATGDMLQWDALGALGADVLGALSGQPASTPILRRWLRCDDAAMPVNSVRLDPEWLLWVWAGIIRDGLPDVLIGQVWRFSRGRIKGGSTLKGCEVYITDVIGDTAYWQMDKDNIGRTPPQARTGSALRHMFRAGGSLEYIRYAGFQP